MSDTTIETFIREVFPIGVTILGNRFFKVITDAGEFKTKRNSAINFEIENRRIRNRRVILTLTGRGTIADVTLPKGYTL